uniref:Uncharacterized protein n=1 Tax=Romanomermis culicivorax TaxID=13658 RepID=A0A915L810_ROMCU
MDTTDQKTPVGSKLKIMAESSVEGRDDENNDILLAVTRENISKQLNIFSRLTTQKAVFDHLVSKPVIARQVLQKLHEIVKLIASTQTGKK